MIIYQKIRVFLVSLVFGIVMLVSNSFFQSAAESDSLLRVPQDFSTIQKAIDAAPIGATVQINPGTYEENLVITKSLKLIGSGPGQVRLRQVPPSESPNFPTLFSHIEIKDRIDSIPEQVWLEDLVLGEPVHPSENDLITVGIMVYSQHSPHIVLKRIAASGYAIGIDVDRNTEIDQAILTHNNWGLFVNSGFTTQTPSVIRNSIIHHNRIAGILSQDSLAIIGNQILHNEGNGVSLEFFQKYAGPRHPSTNANVSYHITLLKNLIAGNGNGIDIRVMEPWNPADDPDDVKKDVVELYENRIIVNRIYGIILYNDVRCHSAPFKGTGIEKRITVLGEKNEIEINGFDSLCPKAYPWPPGFF